MNAHISKKNTKGSPRVSKPREIHLFMVLPAPQGLIVTCAQSKVKSGKSRPTKVGDRNRFQRRRSKALREPI